MAAISEAVIATAQIAVEYRQKFKRDVFVDLYCYRKYGHNELDEPTFTQPTMYKKIHEHPGTRALYAKTLLEQHGFTEQELDAVKKEILEILDLALSYARDFRPRQEVFTFGDAWTGLGPARNARVNSNSSARRPRCSG